MSINDIFNRLNNIYRNNEITNLHKISAYLRQYGYTFTYVDTSICIEKNILNTFDIERLNKLVHLYSLDITIIPTEQNLIKIYIEQNER